MRPPLRSFPLQLRLQPRGSAPTSPACVPCWQYLRVREIVEEEGRELFIQQRAAVVPRHLPAAAAACGGVSAEPARGRERASEQASEEEGGGCPAGGWRAELGPPAAAGGLAAGAGPREPGVAPPAFPAPSLAQGPGLAAPRRGKKKKLRQPGGGARASSRVPAQQCGHPLLTVRANHVALALGGPLPDNLLLHSWGN